MFVNSDSLNVAEVSNIECGKRNMSASANMDKLYWSLYKKQQQYMFFEKVAKLTTVSQKVMVKCQ